MPRLILCAILTAFLMSLSAALGRCEPLPQVGQALPDLEFPAPVRTQDRAALGLNGQTSFRLADLAPRVWILEVIGVYCQYCYEQLPGYNKLFKRLEKAGLAGRVGMLALAAGGTALEVETLQQGAKAYAFPVVPDEVYALHKKLGEPKTPYTLVIGPGGRVAWIHLGVVQDPDQLLALVKGLAK